MLVLQLITLYGTLLINEASKCMVKFDLSVCTSSTANKEPADMCYDNKEMCSKTFHISYVRLEPYSEQTVADMLRRCCGSCLKISTNKTYEYVSQIPTVNNSSSHFYFPVLGPSNAVKLYGYHFLPLVETPSIYYITRKVDEVMVTLIVSCFNMWPLLVNCLLMMILSGFIGWLLETWANESEFPRQYFRGWFEGVWWSFISMTTVGYGDKTPRSMPARIFSIMWIIVGITTFSFITAMLSSELTASSSLPPPTIAGAKVGALKNRLLDTMFIAKHGGVLVDIDAQHITVGITQLISKLKEKEIDGFILDRYTLLLFYRHMNTRREKNGNDDDIYLKTKTIQTELKLEGEYLSYGALVTELADYEFLADSVIDNRNVINTCNNLMLNKISSLKRAEENALFSVSGKVFWPSFKVLLSCIIVLCFIGIVYESFAYMWQKRKLAGDKRQSEPLNAVEAST